jgi:hypothetical protein
MIGRTLRVVLAALVLAAGLVSMPAGAKNFCSPLKKATKGCKNEIAACYVSDCTGLKGHPKAQCKRTCRSDIKAACKLDSTVCTGSPSGAFSF